MVYIGQEAAEVIHDILRWGRCAATHDITLRVNFSEVNGGASGVSLKPATQQSKELVVDK